jgi:hypothetical protein
MVAGLAFLATAIATVFAQATGVRYARTKAPHQAAWTFALASAALATGASTGWDKGTFRAFYLLGAVVNVPWLALGTIYLLFGNAVGGHVRTGLIFFTGLATGAILVAPMHGTIDPTGPIPVGKDVFGAFPRALAGIGSGLGAVVVFVGAVWSAVTLLRAQRRPGGTEVPRARALAGGNALIALGTLILSSGGLVQGVIGHDEAFALSLAIGISVIYAGFVVASGVTRPSARRTTLPASVRGSVSTTSTRVGSL